tara:strand:+ start:540 stop:989 length:450 start_codon:yes stop_codon:yes gene_type:complete
MTNAFDAILNTYDLETCKEIVNHGCQSGVCSQHIYYADTIKFFDTYEDEIIDYIGDSFGSQMNEQLWNDNSCNIDGYKNDTVWAFIELVAMQRVDDAEEQERSDEETIGNYILNDVIDYGKGRLTSANSQQASWYNPAGSMTMSRYANN